MAMLSMASVGYTAPPSVYQGFHSNLKEDMKIAIHPEETDPKMNALLRALIDTYLDAGWVDKVYCVGCYDDYPAWTEYGYSASFIYGSDTSPEHHRPTDTVDKINFQSVKEVVKLTLAFAVEMAEPLEKIYDM